VVAAGAKTAETEVWPENWPVFEVFFTVRTQWRVGFSGPTGLDYSTVYPLIDRETDNKDDWRLMLADLQVMETAALDSMSQKD